MVATNLEELYTKHIRPLPASERLRLAQMIAKDIDEKPTGAQRSLLELEGLGAHLWKDVEAQQYVSELRDEWGHRP